MLPGTSVQYRISDVWSVWGLPLASEVDGAAFRQICFYLPYNTDLCKASWLQNSFLEMPLVPNIWKNFLQHFLWDFFSLRGLCLNDLEVG